MSLNIRYLTNGIHSVYTVTNTAVTPNTFAIYDKRDDIDISMRHYAPDKPQFCIPDTARMFGVLDLFYPNHPKCIREKYGDKICLGMGCRYHPNSKEKESGECKTPPYNGE